MQNHMGNEILWGMVKQAIQICTFPVLMAVLLCAKGGYNGEVTCACGIVALLAAAIILLSEGKGLSDLGVVSFLFAALALSFFAGALANGLTLTTVAEAGTWAGVFGVSIFASFQSPEARKKSLDLLCWLGVLLSLGGLVLYTEIVPWQGAVDAGRLHFPTTYANSAGIWFAATAFLCLLSQSLALRALSPLPIAALMLTRSGGVLATFIVATVAMAVIWWRTGARCHVMAVVLRVLVAAVLFTCMCCLPALPAIACMMAIVVASVVSSRVIGRYLENACSRKGAVLLMAVFCVLASVALIAPIAQRSDDVAYRAELRAGYLRDAFQLLGSSPVLGVGPDNWQFLYQHVQTSSYRTTVVHCSYMQIALDAGFIGLALFVAASLFGMRDLAKARDARCLVPAALLLVHSFIDFDLQFGALAFLLAYLLSVPEKGLSGEPAEKRLSSNAATRMGTVTTCFLMALAFLGCLAGYTASHAKAQITAADAREAVELIEVNELAANDPETRAFYLDALRVLGKADVAARDIAQRGVWYDQQAIVGAEVLYDVGDEAQGASLLIDELEKSPYDGGLFLAARDLFDRRGLPADMAGRYNDAVERADALRVASS